MGDIRPWLILSSIKGIGPKTLKVLIDRFGDPVAVLEAEEDLISEVVGPEKARAIKSRKGVREERIRNTERILQKEDIGAVTLTDPGYPYPLRSLPDPPPVLFYSGILKRTPLVGIVGPRRPSSYTLSLVDSLVSEALRSGYGTVSGGARGVDTRVHLATLKRSGYTVCVLGSGLLKAEGKLLDMILKSGGLLLSEFFPDEPPSRHTFPRRNRVIAGLSEFLVVPEAGRKSGSLITARYAHRYGREVFVHTGQGGERWEGCSALLEEGIGRVFSGPKDIFGVQRCDPLEDFLKTPRTFEEVLRFLGLPPDEAMSRLTHLELEGKVRREGPFYTAC